MAGDDVQALLVELASRPDDLELRGRAAVALDASGKRDEAVRVVAPLVNLAGHDDDGQLPCLCKGCLAGAGRAAESGGMQFVRSFAIAGTRVLHFWMLAEQEREREAVRASVADAMRARLAAVKKAARQR